MVLVGEDQQKGFPKDLHWQSVLGVDLARVEESLRDRESLAVWLARQSDELIASLEERAGMSALKATKKERAARLIASESGLHSVRQALLCRYYLVNRRRDGLERALESIVATRPSLVGLGAAGGDWVRVALEVADRAPECLLWFALWDRALRVGYREFRLAGASGEGLRGMAGGIRIDKGLVDRAIRGGFDGETLRCVDVVPHPQTGAHFVFILHGVGRDRVRTLDGVRHIGRARWIILRLADPPHRLLFSSQGELGARLAEAILAEAVETGPFAYRPHQPQTEHESVATWAEGLVQRESDKVRTYEIDLLLEEAPQVTWKIQGDVPEGLALLARATAAPPTAGAMARRLTRVRLGFREDHRDRWSRFTVWVRPGADETSRIVTYQGHGVTPAERRAFVAWMKNQGISCAPE